MINTEKFLQLAAFYNQMVEIMAAICVNKGGIAEENYVGRFFAADVLEFLAEYGARIGSSDEKIINLVARFREEFERVKTLVTPSQKPIYEMTLEEFEKVMNI